MEISSHKYSHLVNLSLEVSFLPSLNNSIVHSGSLSMKLQSGLSLFLIILPAFVYRHLWHGM